MVFGLRLSLVCLRSQGHLMRNSSRTSSRRPKACNFSSRVFISTLRIFRFLFPVGHKRAHRPIYLHANLQNNYHVGCKLSDIAASAFVFSSYYHIFTDYKDREIHNKNLVRGMPTLSTTAILRPHLFRNSSPT